METWIFRMYGSDAGQPAPSLYTNGLPPLCDTLYMYYTCVYVLSTPVQYVHEQSRAELTTRAKQTQEKKSTQHNTTTHEPRGLEIGSTRRKSIVGVELCTVYM